MANVVSRGQVAGPRRLGLPAEATSFVGREAELAAISELLRTARMVTVTGAAGVGKTRTSVAAAALVADQFPDGVCFTDLGETGPLPGADADLIAAAVAAQLGLPADGGASRPAALLRYLRGKKLLLILDTCEHLVDACAAFADDVLRGAAEVSLLATSRQPLDTPGEHAFPLLPLPAEGDAADLFAQRAAAVLPGFAVTAENRADVLRLCRRLDGIPLAIELAAVRLRALPLDELASQLESGIRTLTVSRRGTMPRHQTLRAAVDWSYQLCNPAEQALWQRLSVFTETFDVAAAEEVCAGGPLPSAQVLPALVGLVDKSVLFRTDAESPRYRLSAALREFGADRLAETDAEDFFLGRLAVAALALAREFDEWFRHGRAPDGDRALTRGASPWTSPGAGVPGTAGGSLAAAFRRLDDEYQNVRAALGWALCAAEPAATAAGQRPAALAERWRLGADLAGRLCCYWQVSGQLDEGRRWLDEVVARFPGPCAERGQALGARGQLAAIQGDQDRALADIGESIRLAEAAGRDGEPAVASGYLRLNLALTLAGRYAEALAAADTARQLLAASGQQSGLLGLDAQLALLHQLTGNTDAAIACCERGLARLAETETSATAAAGSAFSDRAFSDRALSDRALSDRALSDADFGSACLGPGYPAPAPGIPGRAAWLGGYLQLIRGLALLPRPGRERACAAALRQALTAWQQLGDVMGTAYAVEALGWLAARREQFERAAWLLAAADQLWARTGRRLSGMARMEESRQHAVQVTRRSLGERRYTAAYAHGAALTLDAVVRDAVDEAGEPSGWPGPQPGAAAGQEAAGRDATAALTKREREIAELVASGLSNREIAARLFISKRTVDAHVDHIFSKLEISSRVQLTVLLRDRGTQATGGSPVQA